MMSQYQKVLKLGTRKSLLAWSQSSWVAREVERLNPGVSVELVGIETQGDRIVDIPLRQVEGKEFFVAELDDALKSGRVDFSVHSMKDLSLDRPSGFTIAAMPRRENPADIVVFNNRVVDRLANGETITIGTSSPRRLENIPSFLAKALPRQLNPLSQGYTEHKIKFIDIRGNVNTRLSRLLEDVNHERHLDGVVLAAAGLIRLWNDHKARLELQRLLAPCRWMLLPLSQSPGAPAQGVLAVECRSDDASTVAMLRKLHDLETERAVRQERAILQDWGGGCHQRFGAACVRVEGLGPVMWIRGVHPDGHFVDEVRWEKPPVPAPQALGQNQSGQGSGDSAPATATAPAAATTTTITTTTAANVTATRGDVFSMGAYASGAWRAYDEVPLDDVLSTPSPLSSAPPSLPMLATSSSTSPSTSPVPSKPSLPLVPPASAWFVSHSRALPAQWLSAASQKRLWTAGVSSWFRLAAQGLWVEGSADGLGVAALESILKTPLFGLPPSTQWAYLTHAEAAPATGAMPAIATYKLKARVIPEDLKAQVQGARFFYWTSGSQYEALKHLVPPGAHHACGPGKTAAYLKGLGIPVEVFPSEKEWTRWIDMMAARSPKDA